MSGEKKRVQGQNNDWMEARRGDKNWGGDGMGLTVLLLNYHHGIKENRYMQY